MPRHDLPPAAIPIAPRWHVINERDLLSLVSEHAAIDRLCARLEACADRLPIWPDAETADALCDAVHLRFVRHIAREDRLLDLLFACDVAQPLCHTLLDHIHTRHTACVLLAEDVTAVLQRIVEGRQTRCPDAFGYMLRCFFDGCREAMAFEELALLTLADHRLTTDARALLTARIAVSCG